MDVVSRSQDFGSIQFLTGPLAGRVIPITKPIVTLGREPGNDICIADPQVSRQHARLVNNGGQWIVEKLAPQNTVSVNARDIQQGPISNRDTIALGTGTTFMFLTSSDMAGAGVAGPPQAQQFAPPDARPQSSAQYPPQAVPSSPAQQPLQQRAPVNPTLAVPPPPPGASAPSLNLPPPTNVVQQGSLTGVPSIEASSNTSSNKQTILLTKPEINIGRDPSNDLVINELVVSGFHVQIVRDGNQYVLIHPHPARGRTLNGIIYQGRHIPGDQQFRKVLTRGDFFRIGDEHGTLVTIAYNDGSGILQEVTPEIRPIPLGAPLITIGRMPDNNLVLSHPQVSGHHARLEQVPGGYRIVDLGSTNHVYVNGQRVSIQLLHPGDEIRIGPYNLTYTGTELTQRDESRGVRIDALRLKKEGNNHVVILNDISLCIPPRKFVALVGGSGAGKSTLMDALNGLRPAQEGRVYYNGKDYYRNLAAFSTQLGYVPQDDIVHRDLTVERALYYTAKMRLPDDFTEEQIKQRIDEVLDDVEMKFRRNLLVSKLSGGQRKRVSIALELLANPSIFFLDEPTSGLDPGLDRKMMFLLRKLADKGHTIVLVTHATNNINACDYVCFLAQGGRLAYFGPPDEAKAYFQKSDFAEIYSTLEPTDQNPDIPKLAEERFKASPLYQQYIVGPLNQSPAIQSQANREQVQEPAGVVRPKRGDPWKQFSLLSQRYLELLRNDRGNLLILLLQAPVIALILFFMLLNGGHGTFDPTSIAKCSLNPPGLPGIHRSPQAVNQFDCISVQQFLTSGDPNANKINQQFGNGDPTQALQTFIIYGSGGDAQKYLFIMAFAALMFGCINGAREIVKEAPIYRRERTVNLGIIPYMFSKIAVLGVLCLIQSAVLVLVVNVVAPIQQGIILPAVVEVYITMALTSLAGLMVGLAVSAIAPNNDRAVSFIPIILIPQVIFSGMLFQINNPVLQIISAFFAVRWGMAASGSSVGLHGDKIGSDTWTFQGTLYSTFTQAQATFHLLLCWFFLVAMIVILGALTAYFLKRKDVRV
jgi:ABC-type multidrug transport system ATPase subunit/pSer/pThr/pTyr-binding forkhead associated (FHA) protein